MIKPVFLPAVVSMFLIAAVICHGQESDNGPEVRVGPGILNERTYSELVPGRVLTYRLRVDQHVVNGRGVCIPATFTITILDRDEAGNSRVSVQMRSAGELISTDTLFMTKSRELKIVGVRLAFAIPKYEATLDAFGRVIFTNAQFESTTPETITMGTVLPRITDSDAMTQVLSTIPTEYALLAPYLRESNSFILGTAYVDTLLITSSIQKIGQTIGSESEKQPRLNQDTVIRAVTIDSLSGSGDDEVAHMTVRMERHPVYGKRSIATSIMERYIKKGYMKSFVTTSRKEGIPGLIPEYIATSILDSSTVKK
ncbi:MAG TPA: hypothetical protein VK147_13710 [Candidatus Didemnitutus sp.]|nr:hypothetical protein [Candidatus Didemnitutus sp.]